MDCSLPGSSAHGDSPRQEYWSGLPWSPPRDLPNPKIEPQSPTLQVGSLPSEPPGKPMNTGVGSLSLLRRYSQPWNWAWVSCIVGEFLTSWAIREVHLYLYLSIYWCICVCVYIYMHIYWRRKWQPTLVFLSGEFNGQRSQVGYSPWCCKESDRTEWLSLTHIHVHIYTHIDNVPQNILHI